MLLGGVGLVPKSTNLALSTIAYAQGVQRLMGFADIVDKVKPAVISVRVKVASGPKMMGFEGDLPSAPNSQIERFFRCRMPGERTLTIRVAPRAIAW